MSLLSLPIVGQLYAPLVLTSLIIGILILILLEKRNFKWDYDKISTRAFNEDVKPVSSISNTQENITNEGNDGDSKRYNDNTPDKINEVSTSETLTRGEATDNRRRESTESTTCSSSGEDDAATKPTVAAGVVVGVGVGKVRRVHKKKHSCGSGGHEAKICSNKKTVKELTLVADTEDELIKSNIEDLTEQFKSGGLTCTIIPLQDMNYSAINRDASHLHLFVVSSKMRQDLHQYTKEANTTEEQAAFLYSVVCLAPTNTSEITVSGEELCVALTECGGNEWLPLAHITLHENGQGSSSALETQRYITKVLKKISKESKKCCGTSCSSKKAVDIEDLVSSLMPQVLPEK